MGSRKANKILRVFKTLGIIVAPIWGIVSIVKELVLLTFGEYARNGALDRIRGLAWGIFQIAVGLFIVWIFHSSAMFLYLPELLNSLYPKEKAILHFMASNPSGATWLPVEDSAVLSQNFKKCIYPIWNASSLKGSYEAGTAQCFAYSMSDELSKRRDIIRELDVDDAFIEDYRKFNAR